MTCYIALRELSKLQIDPNLIQIKVSKAAAAMQGTSAHLRKADFVSLEALLHGLMLPSGNDAAMVIAEFFGKCFHLLASKAKQLKGEILLLANKLQRNSKPAIVEGQIESQLLFYYQQMVMSPIALRKQKVKDSLQYFVMEMNKQARIFNLKNTNFANPHGLSNKLNYSTSEDIASLTSQALKIEKFRDIVNTKYFECKIEQKNKQLTNQSTRLQRWKNTNKLLYNGFQGVKTGITSTAGPCLAAYHQKDDLEIIIIVLGTKSSKYRFLDCIKMIKWIYQIKGLSFNPISLEESESSNRNKKETNKSDQENESDQNVSSKFEGDSFDSQFKSSVSQNQELDEKTKEVH